VKEPQVDSLGNVVNTPDISLNGWGIVCCIVLGSYLLKITKEVSSKRGYSFTKQCIQGVLKTIPLALLYAGCYFLKGNIEEVMFCLAVLIICKLAATPVNPLPKWRYEREGIEDYSDFLDHFTRALDQFRRERES
jgi:hypothetical protein